MKYDTTKEQLQKIYNTSNSKREILLKLGNTERKYVAGWYYKKLDLCAKNFEIDLTIFSENAKNRRAGRRTIPLDTILTEDANYRSSALKDRLIQAALLLNQCSECPQTNIHNGKPLTLQLDHINGDHFDNRIENLRILCPNCHTQTPTYGGKNKNRDVKDIGERKYKRKHYKRKTPPNWYQTREVQKIQMVIESDIAFSKFGWVSKLSSVINKSHQHTTQWMKRFMPEFYKNNCFKKKT